MNLNTKDLIEFMFIYPSVIDTIDTIDTTVWPVTWDFILIQKKDTDLLQTAVDHGDISFIAQKAEKHRTTGHYEFNSIQFQLCYCCCLSSLWSICFWFPSQFTKWDLLFLLQCPELIITLSMKFKMVERLYTLVSEIRVLRFFIY